jgi:tetratricopeptide (TPR) repeat protein
MTRPSITRPRIAVALAALAALARPAAAAPDARPSPAVTATLATPDEQARDLFRSGHYAEALAIYQRLRAETHHPTYLRNIGRCHQMMRQPQPAIDAFQSYLREARDVDAPERAEIEGYIAEMRRLELTVPPPAGAPPAATVATTSTSAGQGRSVLRSWWFWAGLAALVTAGVIIVVASSGEDRLPCPSGAVCP